MARFLHLVLSMLLVLVIALHKHADAKNVSMDGMDGGPAWLLPDLEQLTIGTELEGNGDHQRDHEAFLGKEEAKSFDQLSPEESKKRLRIIVKKIDKDNDGFLTEQELRDWVDYIHAKYEWDETDKQMKDHDIDHNGKLTWAEYLEVAYGHGNEAEFDHRTDFNYKGRIRRDRRRWEKADEDGDKELTREEFHSYLHPTEAEHMKDLYIEETMEDMDKDKDGFVSLEEYISDIYHHPLEDKVKDIEEPDWVKTRRAQFSVHQDKNNDGKMDKGELKLWMLPQNYSYGEAEAKHLMYEVDSNEDGKLTDKEIIDKYDVFVGSHATHFGKILYHHDEL